MSLSGCYFPFVVAWLFYKGAARCFESVPFRVWSFLQWFWGSTSDAGPRSVPEDVELLVCTKLPRWSVSGTRRGASLPRPVRPSLQGGGPGLNLQPQNHDSRLESTRKPSQTTQAGINTRPQRSHLKEVEYPPPPSCGPVPCFGLCIARGHGGGALEGFEGTRGPQGLRA